MSRAFRFWLAVRLDSLARRVAPDSSLREYLDALNRTGGDPAFRHQGRPLRVRRPDGLTTTHEPPAPWAD